MVVLRLSDLPDELLIHIIRQVPVETRANIRRVSRKWHNIILDIGYHIEPLFVDDKYEVPLYSDDPYIKGNRALPWMLVHMPESEDTLATNNALHHTVVHQEVDFAALSQRRSEFITSPPISMARVNFRVPRPVSRKSRQASPITVNEMLQTAGPTSNRREGIRIGDILDLFDKARAMNPAHDNSRTRVLPSMRARFSHLYARTRVLAKIDRPPAINISSMFMTCKSEDEMAESVGQTASGESGAEIVVDS